MIQSIIIGSEREKEKLVKYLIFFSQAASHSLYIFFPLLGVGMWRSVDVTVIPTRIPAAAWSFSEIKSPQGQTWNLKGKKILNVNIISNNLTSTDSFLLLSQQHIYRRHSLQEFMGPCHLWRFAQTLHASEPTMSLTNHWYWCGLSLNFLPLCHSVSMIPGIQEITEGYISET